ncbi:hypothetical protein OS493_007407 [Desmophyllum pertusum]|uniref:Uncharacterized protein n=1 Tax=Desmophyllum pertusum TaxID=174260 RepID=A0A9W9Z6L2_9CNID|nr:hypothetical protein OS493_007407 [Desmophyllum pertusum]
MAAQHQNTSGFCQASKNRIQANVVVVPTANSEQFQRFCELNKGSCLLLYRSKPGDTTAGNLTRDTDIRTLLPSYFVLKNGQKDSRVEDLKEFPWDDMVTFYIGPTSCHIEKELLAAEIPVQSAEKKRAASQYKTNIQCEEAGPFSCPLVVCMYPIPKQLLDRTLTVTSRLEALHGVPIHIGDPSVIGIKDINRPDYGDPSDMDGSVPVFWASSLTSHLAVKSAGEYLLLFRFCSGVVSRSKERTLIILLLQ